MSKSMSRSRSRTTVGAQGSFTAVCVREWRGAFGGWGEEDVALSSLEPGQASRVVPRIKAKGIGSMNELT